MDKDIENIKVSTNIIRIQFRRLNGVTKLRYEGDEILKAGSSC